MPMDACLQEEQLTNREGREQEHTSGAHDSPARSYLFVSLVVLFDNLLQEMDESLVEILK